MLLLVQAFFMTLAGTKTKTQAKNSSKKLKHQEAFPKEVKNSRKKSILIFFQGGGTCFAIFINKYFQLQEF